MINCLVIGLGRIGMLYDNPNYPAQIWTHTKAISRSKDFNLICGIDSKNSKLQIFKKRFKKSLAYRNISQIPKDLKIDLAIIATPANKHFMSIAQLLKRIKPSMIICEKPIESNIKNSLKILKICKKKRIKLAVNYIRRCDPSAATIKKMIINKQQKFKNSYFHGTIRYSKGLLENGSHFIDLATYWFAKVEKIEIFKKQKQFDYDFNLFFKNAKITFLSCNIKNFQNFSIELFINDIRLRYDFSGYDISINRIIKHKNYQTRNLIMDPKKKKISSQFNIYQKNVMKEVKKVYNNKRSDKLSTGEQSLEILRIIKKIQKKSI